MGEYAVFGASKTTGAEVVVYAIAATPMEAQEIANANGVYVSRVSDDPRDVEEARNARARNEAARRRTEEAEVNRQRAIAYGAAPGAPPTVPQAIAYPPMPEVVRYEVRVRGLFRSVLFGVFGGMTLFVAFGWLLALAFWGTVIGGLGAAAGLAGNTAATPAPRGTSATLNIRPGQIPKAQADGPAIDATNDDMVIGDWVVVGDGEVETITLGGRSHARWRVALINESLQNIDVGLEAAVHDWQGREEWRGAAWVVTVPPGQYTFERTEPLGSSRLTEHADVRLRYWLP